MVVLSPSESQTQVQVLDSGANDVAVMPITADVLKARIRRLVKTKQRSEEQQQVMNVAALDEDVAVIHALGRSNPQTLSNAWT